MSRLNSAFLFAFLFLSQRSHVAWQNVTLHNGRVGFHAAASSMTTGEEQWKPARGGQQQKNRWKCSAKSIEPRSLGPADGRTGRVRLTRSREDLTAQRPPGFVSGMVHAASPRVSVAPGIPSVTILLYSLPIMACHPAPADAWVRREKWAQKAR